MKIGIVSDSHKNIKMLENVVNWLVSKQHITSLYHLGDEYEDVVDMKDHGIEVVQVPGIYHPQYLNGSIEPKIIENVLGLRIMLVHAFEKDITKEDMAITDIILHGHTHRPEIKLDRGLLILNPGHLKSDLDKNVKPSFGVLDIQDKDVTATLYSTDFKEINKVHCIRSEQGLYKS